MVRQSGIKGGGPLVPAVYVGVGSWAWHLAVVADLSQWSLKFHFLD
jgi:hypothetical protein